MRYTKLALLAFGCGVLLGLIVIAAEIKSLERVASGLMAVSIAAIPVGMVADWRRAEAERITRERRPDLWASYRARRPKSPGETP